MQNIKLPQIDIEKIKFEIIERLKPLNPNKIILFGSYAYGTPTKESDIDLFLLKDDLEISDRSDDFTIDDLVGRDSKDSGLQRLWNKITQLF